MLWHESANFPIPNHKKGKAMEIVIGGLITILTAIFIEYLRRPVLQLSIETPPYDITYRDQRPAVYARYLRLKLFNKPLPTIFRWMLRSPALQCRGTITFHHLNDGQNIFDRAMSVRWVSSPEPVPVQVLGQGVQFKIIDPVRLTAESRIDVYPGETELLDVAARFDNEDECYGWNNEAYFSPVPWRSQQWKLERGRYLVKVDITSSGRRCVSIFRLLNDVLRTDFRLIPADKSDLSKIH